jgi:hypothetical protein
VELEQFITLLIKSGIVNRHEAQKVVTALQEGCEELGQEVSLDTFCEFLIATNRLTKWQSDKLRAGKWKGFYLDDYLLLGQVGKGHDSSSYAARDTRNGKLVCLVITPMALSKSGNIEYRVEPYAG